MKRILLYNPKLKDRAKELRKAGVLSEVLLWQELKARKFLDLDFDRQKIIGNYIVDFFCDALQLVIELDGSSHNDKYEYDGMMKYLKDYCKSCMKTKVIDSK